MAKIQLTDLEIALPIFNATSRSLTSKVLHAATGGKLDKDAGGKVSVVALRGINLEINEGERVGVVGHNGSGKSTLLRVLAGVYPPSSGQIQVTGEVGSLIDVGLGINPEASGLENIKIRATLLGLDKSQIRTHVDEIIEFSELGDFVKLPVRTYSSGMHLRLAFAVSTIVRPEILLMDEWLSVGDESFRHKAEDRLSEMVDATKMLIIASHSRDLLEKVCTRVIWLEHGQLKMDGPTLEVLQAYFG